MVNTRAAVAAVVLLAACADAPSSHVHTAEGAAPDGRQVVNFPEDMRIHTLANMRDHLHSLERIDSAMSQGHYEEAATIAEQRLGLTSLDAHGASHLAPFMPAGMQEIGSQMHRAASRFAIEAQNVAATNDVKPALAALSEVMQQCVGCHAAYRMQ